MLCTNIIAERPQNNEDFPILSPQKLTSPRIRIGRLIPSGLVESEMRRSTCNLPTDLVIWLLQQGIGVSGDSADAQVTEIIRESNGRRVPEDHTNLRSQSE